MPAAATTEQAYSWSTCVLSFADWPGLAIYGRSGKASQRRWKPGSPPYATFLLPCQPVAGSRCTLQPDEPGRVVRHHWEKSVHQ